MLHSRHGADLARVRNAQQAAGTQDVDVAVERLRIVLEDGNHGPIDVRARARVRGTGDFPERVVVTHPVGAARLDAGGRRRHVRAGGSRGANGFGGRVGDRSRRTRAGGATRTDSGGRRDRLAGRRTRRVDRRVEQHGVFTEQPAARPVGLHQERHEGFGDRPGRGDAQDVPAVGALGNPEVEVDQERRAVEAVADESVAGGERGTQRPEVLLVRRDQLDFSVKGLIQR